MLKSDHQAALLNICLIGIVIWNTFVWNITELTLVIVVILFIRNYALHARNKTFLDQLEIYEESAERILVDEELPYIQPIMSADNELIGVEFNRLMRSLQRQFAANRSNNHIIRSVSRVIGTPMVILNSSGKIDYANDSFKAWHWGRDIRHIANKELRHILQDALLREIPLKQELNIGKDFYVAHSNPIQDDSKKTVGIVILFHDITELKNYQHLQREFFGNASHELKTPISAIKGCAEILLNGEHSLETYTEFLTIIQDENLRLERLVQDLLLINRYEHQQIELRRENLLLNRLLTNAIVKVLNVANLKKQQIHLDAPTHVPFAGDATMLEHCFLNLLTNAVHYSGEGSVIRVKLGEAPDGKIQLEFKDNGVGIPPSDVPHIFERFYRVDKARSRHSGGSGLGLPIVLSIVQAHGGSISVKSTQGIGTTFVIQFEKNL
ncbi:MAG: ATP-binding protein [Turicibacter sp.]|nr:ATP-binding protein [Turicibacter sp.]